MPQFKNDCFIRKNTIELRSRLEEIGYRICGCCFFDGWDWLHCSILNNGLVHGIDTKFDEDYGYVPSEVFPYDFKYSIDCGTDDEMFLRIANETI